MVPDEADLLLASVWLKWVCVFFGGGGDRPRGGVPICLLCVRRQGERVAVVTAPRGWHGRRTARTTYVNCMRSDRRTAKLAKRIEAPDHSTWASYANCRLVKDHPTPLDKFLLDVDVKALMTGLTGKSDPGAWSDQERKLAFRNGIVPATLTGWPPSGA